MTAPGGATSGGDDVLVERPRPEVALITLNRPDRLNALTSEMLARIYSTLETLGRDATCRVIIVTGAGRGFCAGDDLRDFVNGQLFPYLHGFKQKASGPNTINYKIGEIFGEIKNKIQSGYNLREIIDQIDGLRFDSAEES